MYDAIYARQSIDKKDSISIESQFSMCEHETRGNTFKKYGDKGYSGKNLDRPDFERLMEDIKAGLIKRVIVYKLDRISRSILDFSNLMLFFGEYNVDFVSTTEKFDTSTPVGRAMLHICIVFAQLERETIQQRIFDAYHSRNEKSLYMGGQIPYGFRLENTVIGGIKTSKYIIDEEESAQIKLIYSLYADDNNSLNDIVDYLVKNNIKKLRRGKHWNTSRISDMLRNPVYVKSDTSVYEFFKSQGADIVNDVKDFDGRGCYLYQGTVSTSRKQADLTDKKIVIAPHEGFVSSDEWLTCRLRCLNNKQSTKTCKGKSSWLLGKIKCGNCGYALMVQKSNGKDTRYGNCSSRTSRRICKGTGGTIHIDLVEEYIFNAIKSRLAEFQSLSDDTKSEVNPKIKENELRIAKLDNEMDELLTKVVGANTILMDYINQKVNELDEERKKLQQENISITHTVKKDKLDTVYDHVENWSDISFEDKQSVVDTLIKVIHIANGDIVVKWNI